MFDQYMICEDTLANLTHDGKVIGYRFAARLPYYRGLGLSMVEEVAVTMDGMPAARADIRVVLAGRSWTLDEMASALEQRWNFGEVAEVQVLGAAALAAGEHQVELSERLRISYLPFVPTTRCNKVMTLVAAD